MKVYKCNKRKYPKIILSVLGVIILIPVLTVGSYVAYVMGSYHRIGDTTLEVIEGSKQETIKLNEELNYTSLNFGFGAYSPDFTFFLDEGINKDGTKTVGTRGKAISKDDVIKNTNGLIGAINKLDSDFYAFQEVDVDASRSYHLNQKEMIFESLTNYDKTFAINFDSAYLFYPLNDPHGKSLAGLSTLSRYKIKEANRKEYTIATDFSKFFDLDRCFSVNRIEVENNKELVLINSHMSAYDEGGKIRNTQLHELNSFMKSEAQKGNYVICGGDFNHDLLTNNPLFPEYTSSNFAYNDMIDQQKPEWLSYMFDENHESKFDKDFTIYAANNEPSCRDCDVTRSRGSTFVSTVDGFIVSSNVKVNKVNTLKLEEPNGFSYSDHQPTTLSFKLI